MDKLAFVLVLTALVFVTPAPLLRMKVWWVTGSCAWKVAAVCRPPF